MSLEPLHNPGIPHALRFARLEITAFSISGVATYVLVPAFDACFDLGHCALEASRLRNVFLTHVHQDHSAGALRHHSLRQMFGHTSSRIYVPSESVVALRDVFQAFARMEEREIPDLEDLIRPLRAGESVTLSTKYRVEAFDVVHRIASRGYTVVETRHKLREEYQGRPGAEIQAARNKGETVNDTTFARVFTYVGDSTIETLRKHPELGLSEVLFLEATHLPGTSRDVSAQYGHTHLDEIIEWWRENPEALACAHIVLKHFSTRYSERQIRDAFNALPDGLRERVTMLV